MILRSPLEHEPELIAGIGTLTARWSLLENELADTLGLLIRNSDAGPTIYFALGSFSQRIGLVEGALKDSIVNERHKEIASLLLTRVRRLWTDRNKLVHSHFVHRVVTESMVTWLTTAGPTLGTHPGKRGSAEISVRRQDGSEEKLPSAVQERAFGYRARKPGAREADFTPVNKGTFMNHADAVGKRCSHIAALNRALSNGRIPVRELRERSGVTRSGRNFRHT